MEEQNTTPVVPAEPAPEKSDEPIILGGEKKNSKGMVAGLIILAVLAVAGIAFGIFEMMQASNKDGQIADLNQQVTNCANAGKTETENTTVTCPDGTVVENVVSGYKNPVIEAIDSNYAYNVDFESSFIYNNEANIVSIVIKDGKVDSCATYDRTFEEGNDGNISYKSRLIDNCEVTGIEGEIYKVVEFGSGHMNMQNKIGFIMTDGTIKYIPMYDAVENNDFSIKDSLKIDGYVVDAVNVAVKDIGRGYGGYRATVFVLSDGTTLEYNDSLLN